MVRSAAGWREGAELPLLLFFLFAGAGWVWETALTALTTGQVVNRGFLHGPWLPVYGLGGVLLLGLLGGMGRRTGPLFALSALLGGTVEYAASLALEGLYGQRWWDYAGWPGSLSGRVCLVSLAGFGLAGTVLVRWAGPALCRRLESLDGALRRRCCCGLCLLFAADLGFSLLFPNAGAGISFSL